MQKLALMFRRFSRDARGVTALEFALIAPVLFGSLVALEEFGRLMWTRYSLQHAADMATRHVLVRPSEPTDAVIAYARQYVSGVNRNDVAITVTPEVISGVTFTTVHLTYSFRIFGGLLPSASLLLQGRSRLALQKA